MDTGEFRKRDTTSPGEAIELLIGGHRASPPRSRDRPMSSTCRTDGTVDLPRAVTSELREQLEPRKGRCRHRAGDASLPQPMLRLPDRLLESVQEFACKVGLVDNQPVSMTDWHGITARRHEDKWHGKGREKIGDLRARPVQAIEIDHGSVRSAARRKGANTACRRRRSDRPPTGLTQRELEVEGNVGARLSEQDAPARRLAGGQRQRRPSQLCRLGHRLVELHTSLKGNSR